jgi:hypothetical protein
VQAANRFASAAMAGTAGHVLVSSFSGSATTLAKGVLTTMVLSQVKMFGAGLIAAGLVAGSFGAGAWALASPRQDLPPRQSQPPGNAPPPPPARGVMAQAPSPPAPTTAPPGSHYQLSPATIPDPSGLGAVESRLAELERKLDLLLQQRLGYVNPPAYPPQRAPSRNQSLPKRPILPAPSSNPPAMEAPPSPPTAPVENVPTLQPQPATPPEQSPFDSDLPRAPAGTISSIPPQPPLATPGMPPVAPPPQLEPANQPRQPLSTARELPPPPVQAPPPAAQNRPEPIVGPIDPIRPARVRSDLPASHLPDRTSVHEIEAQLAAAIRRYQRAALLFQNHSISEEEYESYLDQVRLLVGRLKGLREELNEEIDRSNLELIKKRAELKMAEARQKSTAVLVARNARLNERKKGAVSQEDVAKDESHDLANMAQIEVGQAEVQEVELRIKQYLARRESIAKALESTTAAIGDVTNASNSTPTGLFKR